MPLTPNYGVPSSQGSVWGNNFVQRIHTNQNRSNDDRRNEVPFIEANESVRAAHLTIGMAFSKAKKGRIAKYFGPGNRGPDPINALKRQRWNGSDLDWNQHCYRDDDAANYKESFLGHAT